ncbi:MAG: hypothetical protein KF696_12325 [Planctomycetes bacterium]|nr:hypothetical protein [Planctomycetota bacterium]MCW8136585.1 hypothetical protein [Planctomycetota bacterium]
MPLPRILLFAVIALAVMLGLLWAMGVNYAAWIGAWLSPRNQYAAGFGVIVAAGVFFAYMYARHIGEKFPGPGYARGLAFGAIFAVLSIWVVPCTLATIAEWVGNTQVVFQGRGITNNELRADQAEHMTRVEPCPAIGGIEPPLMFLTENHEWAPADGWKGRVLPFGVAFLLWGFVLGVSLSEERTRS